MYGNEKKIVFIGGIKKVNKNDLNKFFIKIDD